MPEFQPYLDSIDRRYSQRCKYYTLMDAEGQQKQESVPFFDFGFSGHRIAGNRLK
jgi:hypothetical protein